MRIFRSVVGSLFVGMFCGKVEPSESNVIGPELISHNPGRCPTLFPQEFTHQLQLALTRNKMCNFRQAHKCPHLWKELALILGDKSGVMFLLYRGIGVSIKRLNTGTLDSAKGGPVS